MIITPDMINWREGFIFGFRKNIIDFGRLAATQRIGVGKKRRFIRFTATKKDVISIVNEIHSEFTNEFTVIVPTFPIRPVGRGTTNYQGETKIYIQGNIFKRPLTCYSSLTATNPKYYGYETLILYNKNTQDIEEVDIETAGAYINGIEYAENGQPFFISVIELVNPIVMSVQEKDLFIYNFFTGRLVDDIQIANFNDQVGETELEFEEIFSGEIL